MKKIILLSLVFVALTSTFVCAADWLPMEEYRDFKVANTKEALENARKIIVEAYGDVSLAKLKESKSYVHSVKDQDIETVIVMIAMSQPNDYYLAMLDNTGLNPVVLYTVEYKAPLKQFLKKEVAEKYEDEGGW